MNDLNKAIKYSDVHPFADDTKPTTVWQIFKKDKYKHISHDLKLLNIWLIANKILNASKTEIIQYKPKSQSNITKHPNLTISG